MFFNKKQKELALTNQALDSAYAISERNLQRAARTGSTRLLRKAMAEHHDIEYAVLYRQTPEFAKKCCKGVRSHAKKRK